MGAFPARWILTANLTSQGLPSWSHQMSFAGRGSSAGTAVSLQATGSTHSIKFYGVLVWSLSRTSEDIRTLWIFSPPAKCGGECPLFLLLRGSLFQQSAVFSGSPGSCPGLRNTLTALPAIAERSGTLDAFQGAHCSLTRALLSVDPVKQRLYTPQLANSHVQGHKLNHQFGNHRAGELWD